MAHRRPARHPPPARPELVSGSVANHPASFRDPSGYVFSREGVHYRRVNQVYREDFERLLSSGLYDRLAADGRLISHREVETEVDAGPDAYKTLLPRQVSLISYPYEWCFSQLKDAALQTLSIQLAALNAGMSLKDASAYNIQWVDGKATFIDTLSFERYEEGKPWVAYRQFCQHFLAPLALMARTDIRLSQLARIHIDGVPLDLASSLLPFWSRANFSLGIHVHAHARSQRTYASSAAAPTAPAAPSRMQFTKHNFEALIDSLQSAVSALSWQPVGTEWGDYYERNNNYSAEGMEEKQKTLAAFLDVIRPKTVWDLGANTGRFSRIAAAAGAQVTSWDIDPACVEGNYRHVVAQKETNILPLLQDLTNPSPGLGWAHAERDSLAARGPVDAVLALGLIHHLAISNNVPLEGVASFLSRVGRSVILEFVPKEDSQVEKLLATRKDVFPNYHRAGFEAAFAPWFSIAKSVDLAGTKRTLYLLERRGA